MGVDDRGGDPVAVGVDADDGQDGVTVGVAVDIERAVAGGNTEGIEQAIEIDHVAFIGVEIGDHVVAVENAGKHETVGAGVAALGVDWGYHGAEELRASGAARVVESFPDLPSSLATLN